MSKRAGIMLCYPFEERRLVRWEPPYIIQPKLDGIRCRAMLDGEGNVDLWSSEMNSIVSVPHIEQELKFLSATGVNIELDGELYRHGEVFEDIISVTSRTVNISSNHDMVQYHIFDIVDFEVSQSDRILRLDHYKVDWFNSTKCIQVVPFYVTDNLAGIMEALETLTKMGYEGIVIRHHSGLYVRRRSTFMMKFKPYRTDVYNIVGVVEEMSIKGVLKGTLGALICTGGEEEFRVGSGFTADERREYWKVKESLIGKYAIVKYQHLTSKEGVPRFPVIVEIIADKAEILKRGGEFI